MTLFCPKTYYLSTNTAICVILFKNENSIKSYRKTMK